MTDKTNEGQALNRRSLLRNVAVTGVAMAGSSTLAAARQETSTAEGPEFEGGVTLTPTKKSEKEAETVGINQIIAKKQRDSTQFYIEGTVKGGSYSVEPNFEQETYALNDVTEPNTTGEITTQVAGTDCARVEVRTLDPANVVCAYTKHELEWNLNTNFRTASFSDRWGQATAYQPTAAGTNWYTDHIYFIGSPDSVDGGRAVQSELEAEYWNSDFPCGTGKTYARHRYIVEGDYQGHSDYFTHIEHWGECQELLHPRVETKACRVL